MKHILTYLELGLYIGPIAYSHSSIDALKDGWDLSIGDKDSVQIPSRRLPYILNLHLLDHYLFPIEENIESAHVRIK